MSYAKHITKAEALRLEKRIKRTNKTVWAVSYFEHSEYLDDFITIYLN